MSIPNQREYKGESELEYYGLLSPDDVPEIDTCDGCGDAEDEFRDTPEGLWLCPVCYAEYREAKFPSDEEEECEN
jgi:hypothetical protein